MEGVLKEADYCIPELWELNKHLLKKPKKFLESLAFAIWLMIMQSGLQLDKR